VAIDVKNSCDVLIIGGGINGAAVARDASLRGLDVVLVEQNDIGSGASSKTSKLAHGGLRYLEYFELRLVRESLIERDLLVTNAASYVTALPFVFPVYAKQKRPLWKVKLGLSLYDWLSRKGPLPRHQNLSPEDVATKVPGLRTDGLVGGCLYYDSQMQDRAIVEATLDSASKAGAVVYTQTKLVGFEKEGDMIVGATLDVANANKTISIRARIVVNVAGAWSNQVVALDYEDSPPVVCPTKGVHIVTKRPKVTVALTLTVPKDGRIFFIMPWQNQTLIGTTDTPYTGDPDQLSVKEEDLNYLLDATNYYFPEEQLDHSDILSSFSGLRPLAVSGNVLSNYVSRDFKITESRSGLMTMVGGKFTTHRKMAEVLVNRILRQLKYGQRLSSCQTKSTPL